MSDTDKNTTANPPPDGYETVKLSLGLERPLRFLLIADSHLIQFDGRDGEVLRQISERRHREYEVNNVGRNLPYLLRALSYAKKHCDLLLHAGDLIDMVSLQNLETAALLLEDVDYFFACGNHEYTHYSGQHPESDEQKAYARRVVPGYFRHDLDFASRRIAGLNLVSLYNGDYQITPAQHKKFEAEIARGLPILFMVHNPFYTPALHRYRRDVEKETRFSYVAAPEEVLSILGDGAKSVRADADTVAFVEWLKKQPLVKGVLAGHIHLHSNQDDVFFGQTRQYVVGGGYYGCGMILEIS